MKQVLFYFLLLTPSLLFAQKVLSIKVDGSINPVSAGYISDAIDEAQEIRANCIILHLNTPGGLLKSTRVIVRDILESPVPVVVYVSPGGAHAGSAGVFITLSANVAAMAPGTNIGAAHPVSMQGPIDTIMNQKATNDAAAFIRSIAEKRNRNLKWAEEAVRKSVSITDNEALKLKVIDLIALNEKDLLQKIHNRKTILNAGTVILNTKNAKIVNYDMGFTDKILDVISDPTIAYIILLMGIYGVMFELFNPGAIFPGTIGIISLILAFYAMHSLPINYAGLALIAVGVILFVLELNIISHGILAIGGTIAFLFGSLMLFRSSSPLELINISKTVIISSTVLTLLFFIFVIGLGLKAQRLRSVTGIQGLIGDIGEAKDELGPSGTVSVQGEVWNAESIGGNISKGEKVRIKRIENLKLFVEPLIPSEKSKV